MAEAPGASDSPDAGITISRVFDAPRERLWKEWTEPERFADWYGGEEAEIPISTVSMDVTEGGAWRATMLHRGREIQWRGEYLEVIEPERLVFTVADGPGEEYELVIVVLSDLGDGRTEMRLEQRGRMSAEQYKRAGEGWSTFFDRIDARLSAG
jgi:uncharacterized protein YndB with AHSA1/START domain